MDLDLLDTIKDTDENILIVNCKINNTSIILGSVYGPNLEDNRSFFNKIDEFLNRFKDTPVILGGDWNTTVSDLPPRENPDIFNMLTTPSRSRTGWLVETMATNRLIDPFRFFSPNTRDFSYQPSGSVRNNRSKIDFFSSFRAAG